MNLSNINVTIKELEDMRINQELSWDEIAIRVGKARNTIKRTIIKECGEDVWKALSKKEHVKFPEPKQEKKKPKEKLNIGSKSEPTVKHFISELEDGSVNIIVFINDKKLSKTFKSPVMTLKVIDAVKAKDITALEIYLSMSETISKAGITYDEVANKYNINGVVLDSACRELIMKCYNDTVNGHHDSITGLTAMVHDLNKSKKLHLLNQLYGFLTHNDVEILNDGSFICYKYLDKTDSGYVDHYSNSIKQQVGDYVYTFEELVNNDPNVTCSYGLIM